MTTDRRAADAAHPTDGASPFLTIAQLADRWHTTKKTIYNLRSAGKLPPGIRRGRNVLIPLAAITAKENADLAVEQSRAAERERQMRPAARAA